MAKKGPKKGTECRARKQDGGFIGIFMLKSLLVF